MIDVLITYTGREFYLRKLLDSLNKDKETRIIIVENGAKVPDNLTGYDGTYTLPGKVSIGVVMEFSKSFLSASHVLKLDDDAKICSSDFFRHVKEIIRLKPNAIFSPFPVGLINNLGGPGGVGHEVIHSEITDTFYTLRRVNHVGGFARVCPTSVIKQTQFSDSHSEDGEVSYFARNNSVEMFYLENALIVEHQESTLGQHERYKEYFGQRF